MSNEQVIDFPNDVQIDATNVHNFMFIPDDTENDVGGEGGTTLRNIKVKDMRTGKIWEQALFKKCVVGRRMQGDTITKYKNSDRETVYGIDVINCAYEYAVYMKIASDMKATLGQESVELKSPDKSIISEENKQVFSHCTIMVTERIARVEGVDQTVREAPFELEDDDELFMMPNPQKSMTDGGITAMKCKLATNVRLQRKTSTPGKYSIRFQITKGKVIGESPMIIPEMGGAAKKRGNIPNSPEDVIDKVFKAKLKL